VTHTPQFNGKQEGDADTARLTCAAPATVSGRTARCRCHHGHWVFYWNIWEGDGGWLHQPGYRPTRRWHAWRGTV